MVSEIDEWNKSNYPYRIINVEKDKNLSIIKTPNLKNNYKFIIVFIFSIVIVFSFLAIVGLRTYYYDLFKDNVNTFCNPNVTLNIEPTKCGDVSVECDCVNSTTLTSLLSDYNNINYNITNSS